MAQGIFASAAHTALEAAQPGDDFMPDRMDRLRLRRWRAIAYRKTRLLRDLFQIGHVPCALVRACWDDLAAFPELAHYLWEMQEARLAHLRFRPCEHAHLVSSWIERELRVTGQLQRAAPFGVTAPQSPPQWRTCLMVPAGLEVPLGQVCLFQGEALVFLEAGDRLYRIRENEVYRYGWHLLPSGADAGIYMMGRLAEDAELCGAVCAQATFDLGAALGAPCDRPHVLGEA